MKRKSEPKIETFWLNTLCVCDILKKESQSFSELQFARSYSDVQYLENHARVTG